MTTVYIIIPQTEEIIPFKISTISDTFSIIINELQRQNKPHHILFYNEIQTIEIKPQELINSYLMLHQSQVTFWAYDQPVPNFPILDINKDNLLLQIIGPQYELYTLQVESHFTIEYIILMLNNLYNVNGNIYKMNVGLLLPYDTISDVLPARQEQIILMLGNDPAIAEKYSYLYSMPDEVIWEIIKTLPVGDILSLCSSTKRFEPFCQDELLWKELMRRDFGVDAKPQNMTWEMLYFSRIPSRYRGIIGRDGVFRIIDKRSTEFKTWYKQLIETFQPVAPQPIGEPSQPAAPEPARRGRPRPPKITPPTGVFYRFPGTRFGTGGMRCDTLTIGKLLEILYYFDVLPNINIELPDIDIITQTLRTSFIFKRMNIDDMSEEEKIFYYKWHMFLDSIKTSMKAYLCNILQQTFIDKKLMLDAGQQGQLL